MKYLPKPFTLSNHIGFYVSKITIWVLVWLYLSPFFFLHSMAVGIGQGSVISTAIIAAPLLALFGWFLVLEAINQFSENIPIIFVIIAIYLYIGLLIKKSSRTFALKLFDYPNIQSLLWGAFSAFLRLGPYAEKRFTEIPLIGYEISKDSITGLLLLLPGKTAMTILVAIFTPVFQSLGWVPDTIQALIFDLLFNIIAIAIAYVCLKVPGLFMRLIAHRFFPNLPDKVDYYYTKPYTINEEKSV